MLDMLTATDLPAGRNRSLATNSNVCSLRPADLQPACSSWSGRSSVPSASGVKRAILSRHSARLSVLFRSAQQLLGHLSTPVSRPHQHQGEHGCSLLITVQTTQRRPGPGWLFSLLCASPPSFCLVTTNKRVARPQFASSRRSEPGDDLFTTGQQTVLIVADASSIHDHHTIAVIAAGCPVRGQLDR